MASKQEDGTTDNEMVNRSKQDSWPRITLFGDSITRYSMDPQNGCWAAYLYHELSSYFQIDVKGFSGYTTKWALELVPKLFTKAYLQSVELFVIFFGHNDAWQADYFPGVDVKQYEINLQEIIRLLLENGLRREQIIVITPGWYNQPGFTQFRFNENKADLSKTLEHSREYAEAAARVAKQSQVALVDWWSITLDFKPFDELFNDGLHLSQTGGKVLFQSIWPLIRTSIEAKHKKPICDLSMVDIPAELCEARRKSSISR